MLVRCSQSRTPKSTPGQVSASQQPRLARDYAERIWLLHKKALMSEAKQSLDAAKEKKNDSLRHLEEPDICTSPLVKS